MNLETRDQLHPTPMSGDYHLPYSKQNKFQLTRPIAYKLSNVFVTAYIALLNDNEWEWDVSKILGT